MYAKIFRKMLDSSIWLESHETRCVWLTLLVSKDAGGFCSYASVENLARRANISLKDTRRAVRILESPDPRSSDPEHEGRRIERFPGGWQVLNAAKYTKLARAADLARQNRDRVRKHRELQRGTQQECNGAVMLCNAR